MSIKFYEDINNKMIEITSAKLDEDKIANFVTERGLKYINMPGDNTIYYIPWKLFLELVRNTMVETQQELNPDFMRLIDNSESTIEMCLPIEAKTNTITSKFGMINIVPDMLMIPDEYAIAIKISSTSSSNKDKNLNFCPPRQIEGFTANTSNMINNILFIGGLLLVAYIIYYLMKTHQ
jgi:hypothetical protein